MRLRRIVVCGLSGSTMFFPHYLINVTAIENELIQCIVCVLISLQLLYKTILILRIFERDMFKNVYRSLCEVPVIIIRS